MSRISKQNGYGKVKPIDGAAVSGSAWGVWCALCTFAKWETDHGQPVKSKEGKDLCIPRVEVVARRAHISSVRTVQAAIKELVTAGYVRVCPRYGRKSKGAKGEQRSNGYILYPLGNAPISEEERQEVIKKMAAFTASLNGGSTSEPGTPSKNP